jgi:hypothetical protein
MIKTMGVTRHLNIPNAEPPPDFVRRILQLPLQHGKRRSPNTSFKNNDQERVCTQLAKHLDSCFKKAAGFKLTAEGHAIVANWAGEIITNAEEHSGETIYQSLNSPNTSKELRDSIEALVRKHTSRGFFSLSSRYTAAELWTLYALQDGVSRLNQGYGTSDRGRGTVQLIEAFQELGRTIDDSRIPSMVLVSGNTKIVFDGKYKMQEETMSNGGRRHIIAFNKSNSLDERPDQDCVMKIDGFFPGTLLALRFYLDQRFLKAINKPLNTAQHGD